MAAVRMHSKQYLLSPPFLREKRRGNTPLGKKAEPKGKSIAARRNI
jgi:hypothetical protein